MARIRTIKPEFWSSPSVAGADPWVRLLYIAMWNWADDHGRGTANAKELAAFAFPHDDDPGAPTSAELPCMLAEVADRFGVLFYEAGGRRYYAIPSWDTHQRNERRAKSRHPHPAEGLAYHPDPSDQRVLFEPRKLRVASVETHGSSVQTDGRSGAGTGEQGNRGTTPLADQSADRDPNPTPPPTAEPDPFDRFWQTYPKRVKKQDALKAWRQALRRTGVTADKVIAAAEAATRHWQRQGTEPQYIPYPASWLRAGGYDDDLDQAARPSTVRVVPTFDDLRRRGDAPAAATLIGATYIERPQPPSDGSDPYAWQHDRGVEWIDQHAEQIHAALTARRTG